jgi:hypothetical protein
MLSNMAVESVVSRGATKPCPALSLSLPYYVHILYCVYDAEDQGIRTGGAVDTTICTE